MQRIMLALCVSVSLVNIAHSASKLTIRRTDANTVTITQTELVPLQHSHSLNNPAPPNACDVLAFEILNRRSDEPRCVRVLP